MSLTSNKSWTGYLAWQRRVGYSVSEDTRGPWFDWTTFGLSQGTLYGTQLRNSGKLYFEFNYRGSPTEVDYQFGLVTPNHDVNTLPGYSADSWAYVGGSSELGFYHDSVKTTITDSYLNINGSDRGYYYNFTSYFHNDGDVVKVAIDFDAGKLWFGLFNGSIDTWDGDPAAGTDPTYTFTPGTGLIPALGWKFIYAGFLCTAVVQLGASRDYARRAPPTGFTFWDTYPYQEEVLADNPVGYWIAGPHVHGEIYRLNPLGYGTLWGDSSLNQKYTEHYQSAVYNALSLSDQRIFPAQPAQSAFAEGPTYYGKYPASLSSELSFSIETSVFVTGPGATNGGSDTWLEGSCLVANHPVAWQQNSWTLGDYWLGITLRARRFKFHLAGYEVTAGADISDGPHHIVVTFDHVAQTMTLYIDAVQAGQLTSVAPSPNADSMLCWGCLRPTQTNGNFPGYFRDCAFYPSALSAARVTAHYDALQVGYMPNPISSLIDGRTARFPYHAV